MFKSDLVQSALSFMAKIGSGFAAYILFAIVSRNVGPEAFGQFSVLFSLAIMIGIAGSMGLQVFVVREIPKQRVAGNKKNERAVYRFSFLTLLFALPFILVVYGLSAPWIVDGSTVSTIAIGAGLAVFYAYSQTTFGMLRIQDATIFAVLTRDLLWRVLAIPLFIVLIGFVSGPLVGLAALFVALVPILLWHLIKINRHIKSNLNVEPGRKGEDWIQSIFGLGLVGVISSADFYIYTVLLGLLLNATEAGVFFAALKTAELLNMFLMAVTLVIAPKLSHYVATQNTELLQKHCNLGLLLQTVPLVISFLILFPMAKFILAFFDPSFGSYAPLLWLLALVMLFNSLTGATVLLMQVGNMHWLQVGLQGGFLLLSIAALPLLVAQYGVYGAAISFGLSKLLWNVAAIFFIRKNLKVDPSLLGFFRRGSGGLFGALDLMKDQFKTREQKA